MPTVFFQTFGCQMNVADSDEFGRLLSARGYVAVDHPEGADLIVVNTCSVREHAEQRARARIAEFAAIKSRTPGALLWVVGCMAERLGERLRDQIPGVDLVIGARSIDHTTEILDRHLPDRYDSIEPASPRSAVSDFVPIMRGCNNYCSYCIVPYVRGPEKSIPAADIVDAVRARVGTGVKEVTLLGQNVNSYHDGDLDFPGLLEAIARIDGLERIRFTTSHPKDCTRKLIETIAREPKLCRHIHLPVQAGADRILSSMNRGYTAEHYLRLIESARHAMPDVDITTDIIVGFPSESHAEYEETLALVKQARFTTAFMFAYSPRSGTAAAQLPDSVPHQEKMERLRGLIELQTSITRELYETSVGRELEVMLTGRQEKRDRLWMGLDTGCKRVLLPCSDAHAGTILGVRAVRSSGMTLICERIDR